MRYLVFTPPKPDYDYRTFDFDRDTGLLDTWGKLANANNPDLSAFTGRYFEGRQQIRSSDESYNDERAEDLWNASVALTAPGRSLRASAE